MTVPDQTVEEAESGIREHAMSLVQVKDLLELEAWKDAQKELRKSASYLKQDIYTIIQGKPGPERAQLRNLYSKLFNGVTELDYAARDKDVTRVWKLYEDIVFNVEKKGENHAKNKDKMQTGIIIIEGLGNPHKKEPSSGPSHYAEEATSVYETFLDEPKQVYTMDTEYRGVGHSYITWAANTSYAQGSRRLKTNCNISDKYCCVLTEDDVKITEDAAKITGIMFTALELLPSESRK
nr:PsbQ-like protein 3, chloroplastic [Tanacetum cinerariifolium]